MLAIKDTIFKHPEASLLVLFISAFTAFALTGDDNHKKKKKPSLLKKVLSYLVEDDTSYSTCGSQLKRGPVETNGIASLLESTSSAYIYQACWSQSVSSLPSTEDIADVKIPLEQVIEQLRMELNAERDARIRLRDSVKREEALRLDAEEGLRLLETELTRQKRKTKKLKKEKGRMKHTEQRLREEEAKVRNLEKRLEAEQERADQLEKEAAKHRNGYTSSEEEDDDRGTHTNRNTNGREKRVFTII